MGKVKEIEGFLLGAVSDHSGCCCYLISTKWPTVEDYQSFLSQTGTCEPLARELRRKWAELLNEQACLPCMEGRVHCSPQARLVFDYIVSLYSLLGEFLGKRVRIRVEEVD